MAGFNYNEVFTILKAKMGKAYPACKVDRYITPKESQMPYMDVALADLSGGHYSLSGEEGSQNPLLTLTVYATGSLADNTCSQISEKAKAIMLEYGWQCKSGPLPVPNAANPNIVRWVSRYQRVVASGDKLVSMSSK